MVTLTVKAIGHALSIVNAFIFASGSVAVDEIHFDLDEYWGDRALSALFYGTAREEPYEVPIDANGDAVVPVEILSERSTVQLGIYGVDGSTRITSTLVSFKVKNGAWSEDATTGTNPETLVTLGDIRTNALLAQNGAAAAAASAEAASGSASQAASARNAAQAASTAAQAAAAQAAANAEHYPIIRNGTWHIWSVADNDYINTEVDATRPQGEGDGAAVIGNGIISIAKTNTSGLVDTYTITYTSGDTDTFTITNGADGRDGTNGTNGTNGANGSDGTTFTPSVSSAGVISWSNDGGKTNPTSVDLVAAVIAALPSAVGVSF